MFEWQQVSQTLYIQSLLGNEMTTIRISNIKERRQQIKIASINKSVGVHILVMSAIIRYRINRLPVSCLKTLKLKQT